MLDWIQSDESNKWINHYKAWYSVGPACLTRFLETGNYPDFMVFPSHFFLPHHFTGLKYEGHKKVFAHQEWCNTDNKYNRINYATLPIDLQEPSSHIIPAKSSIPSIACFIFVLCLVLSAYRQPKAVCCSRYAATLLPCCSIIFLKSSVISNPLFAK